MSCVLRKGGNSTRSVSKVYFKPRGSHYYILSLQKAHSSSKQPYAIGA